MTIAGHLRDLSDAALVARADDYAAAARCEESMACDGECDPLAHRISAILMWQNYDEAAAEIARRGLAEAV